MTPGNFRKWIVSGEDFDSSKLYWARDSKSEMQLRDVENLLTADCDMPYVYSRPEELGVKALLMEVLGTRE